jgi:hypothetical protein
MKTSPMLFVAKLFASDRAFTNEYLLLIISGFGRLEMIYKTNGMCLDHIALEVENLSKDQNIRMVPTEGSNSNQR